MSSPLQVLWKRPGDIANLRRQPPDALHIRASGQYRHESSPRGWEYTGRAHLRFSPDVLPRLQSSWSDWNMPRVSGFSGQTPLETTFLFIFDDKLFISLPFSPALAPDPGHHVGWEEGMAS